MGQTSIKYNGVQIHHCLTKRFEQRDVYEDSGTDYLYTKFNVSVIGYIHANLTNSISGNTGPRVDVVPSAGYDSMTKNVAPNFYSGGAANNFNVVRARLAEPRKLFEMRLNSAEDGTGGTLLLSVDKVPTKGKDSSRVDANNGPKPQLLSITHVVADNVLRIEWEIEIARVECTDDGFALSPNKTGVLSNRWSMTDEIDNNAYTTRTIQGRLRVLSAEVNPHSFRDLVVPGLNKYFRRDRMMFVATADGLNLDYTIVDKEIAFAAPFPATSWHFEIVSSMTQGSKQTTTISIRLSCPRVATKTSLIMIAAQIIDARGFRDAQHRTQAGLIVREVTFTDTYGDNENMITARAVMEHVGGVAGGPNPAAQMFLTAGRRLGHPLTKEDFAPAQIEYTFDESKAPNWWNDKGEQAGPTGIAGAFSAFLQNSCDATDRSLSDLSLDPQTVRAKYKLTYTMQATILPTGTDLPQNKYSTFHIGDHPYTHYKIENRYKTNSLSVQMPIADFSGSSGAPTATVVHLSKPTAKRVVRVSAERVNAEPQVPNINDVTSGSGIKSVALDLTILPMTRQMTVDGKYLYRTEFELEYAQDRPYDLSKDNETIPVGVAPWIQDPSAPSGIGYTNPAMFSDTILPP